MLFKYPGRVAAIGNYDSSGQDNHDFDSESPEYTDYVQNIQNIYTFTQDKEILEMLENNKPTHMIKEKLVCKDLNTLNCLP